MLQSRILAACILRLNFNDLLPELKKERCHRDSLVSHDDVIKWKHFPRNWPFVRGIHRPPVNSPHKGQWRGALMFSLICVWINGWVNNREAGDLRRHRAHYDVIVMCTTSVNVTGIMWVMFFNIDITHVIHSLRTRCSELEAAWNRADYCRSRQSSGTCSINHQHLTSSSFVTDVRNIDICIACTCCHCIRLSNTICFVFVIAIHMVEF